MKRFKKIYLEITNSCNLSCSFCNKTNREQEFISIEKFTHVLKELETHTDYLYFHVMGEPLIHPSINELIDLASHLFKINITTNGILLNKITSNKNIRQVNISLHSLTMEATLKEELIAILVSANKLTNSIINYRLWIKNDLTEEIIDVLNDYYNTDINSKSRSFKIKDKVFVSFEQEFVWPDLANEIDCEEGTCLGLKEHIGILVDGTVIPCCLDSNGIINLGNIFDTSLDHILNSERAKNIIDGFKNNTKCEPLCKKCNFYNKRKKIKELT